MSKVSKVAVVTGSNKGIGYAIVKLLCEKYPDWIVYLTARDPKLGEEAVKNLEKQGRKPKFHQLDITDKASIEALAAHISKTHKDGLDVLVNNAGMAYKASSTASFTEQAEVTVSVNFTGTLNVCESLFPLLKPGARVVNVSSFVSRMAFKKCGEQLREKFRSTQLTMEKLQELMQQFVDDVKVGRNAENGWPSTAYGVSKIGVTIMTVIQQKMFDVDPSKDIIVNAACPGYVNTDMSSGQGKLTPEEGADTPIFLATLPKDTKFRGKLLQKREVLELD